MKSKRLTLSVLFVVAAVANALACTNLIVGKNASADGSTIVSYSADSYGLFGELYHYPAGMHKKGTLIDIHEWDTGKYLGQIEQARQTYNVIGNMNEFQLTIGETTFGGRPELVDTTGIIDYGSLIYLGLQRSRTAREAINKYGVDPIIAVKAACHHASRYFLLNNRGAIAPGYLADFAVIDNFKDFNVEMVFKKGILYWNNGELRDFEAPKIEEYLDKRAHDTFHVSTLTPDDFRDTRQRGVLGMVPGEIITTDNGYADHVDLEKDILKIAVVERHKGTHHIGLGYIQGYGLKSGAVATSISHDSHNIIVVGTNSADMAFAANYIVEHHGGIVVVENGTVKGDVVLEIAGIMSDRPLTEVNDQLEAAKDAAFTLGVSRGIDPFMTLSFMALPVIPKLRITTRGVIDVDTQQYV